MPRMRSDAVLTSQAGGAVLLDKKSGRYYKLNSTAGRVAELLREETEIDSIVADLEERYPACGDNIRSDVVALIEQLRLMDLLEQR